jgi:TetR/AcrR family transcriptional regulator, cholesterol catabolism regulator
VGATKADAGPAGLEAHGRERILDAAAALFVESGYEATSLRRLAELAGIKAGSLYYHFESKDDLLTAVLRRGVEVMHRAFDEADQRTTGSAPAERVEAHVRAHLAALFEHGPYTAAHVVTFRTAPPAVRDIVLPARDAYEARWTALLLGLRADGAIAGDVDIGVARLALFGAMNSSLDWFDPQRGALDVVAAAIARQFWTGVSA